MTSPTNTQKCSTLLIFFAAILLSAGMLFTSSPAVAQESVSNPVTIVYPSNAESTLAPERDFYVIGTGYQVAQRGVKVELFTGTDTTAAPIRNLVYNTTNAANFTLSEAGSIPALSHLYNDTEHPFPVSTLLMPDLSYIPTVSNSASDPAVKISANSQNFAALIFGGASDNLGIAAESKLNGTYTLRVTLGINTPDTTDDEATSKLLTFADTENKVASRFSPDNHLSNVKAAAAANNFRTYIDPFPGYWSPQNMGCIYYDGALYTKRDVFIESYQRWRFADALEYQAGNVQLYLYNISPNSTTQSVEVSAVQRTKRIDTQLFCWYYDIGEPTILTNEGSLTGTLIPLSQNDKMALTRAHIGENVGADNKYATYQTTNDTIDTNYADGLEATEGQELAFFGVTAPLQNSENDIVHKGEGFYTIKNDVDAITYRFVQNGVVVYEETKSVDLFRDFATDWKDAESTYEFKHCFTLTNTLKAGLFEVQATALDSYGNSVAGGTEAFTLKVNPINCRVDPEAVPASPTDSSSKPLAPTGDNTTLFIGLGLGVSTSALVAIFTYRRKGALLDRATSLTS